MYIDRLWEFLKCSHEKEVVFELKAMFVGQENVAVSVRPSNYYKILAGSDLTAYWMAKDLTKLRMRSRPNRIF